MSLHLTLVTFTLFAVYAYRDIWPLMTFTLEPADKAEGSILWVKVAFVAFVGAVEPMFEPYVYIPVDPQNPSTLVNPEQTASIFSSLLYTFLDPTIWLAIRLRNLSLDQLPPLCDYDSVKNLIKRSYRRLDPFSGAKRGNLFFGFVKIFNVSLFYQTVLLIIMAATTLAGPIGTNRLLNYLEQTGDGAIVRPWVWIVCLAAGPSINNVLFQLYLFFSTSTDVRVQGIITSLVFDHALRMRLKAEISDKQRTSISDPITSSNTPSSSIGGSEMEGSTTAHLLETSASTSTTAVVVSQEVDHTKATPFEVKEEEAESDPKATGDNLVGKLNNLVTSDLNNISKGCDFLLVVVSAPLQIALAMWFLYGVLGWSAFIGLAVMFLLLPLPAWVASLMNDVQQQQMKSVSTFLCLEYSDWPDPNWPRLTLVFKVSLRVGTSVDRMITQLVEHLVAVMGVLRMIKLFGWETRVKGAASAKREEELRWIFKNKMFQMLINIIGLAWTCGGIFAECLCRAIFEGTWETNYDDTQTELLDTFTEQPTDNINTSESEVHKDDIGCGNAHFTWTNGPTDGGVTPSKRTFRLRIEDELVFKKGGINLIVGPTGVGKTSVLMALLGEMHYIPLGPNSWTNLPREGGVAFVAQESWIQSETIRDNILFGAPYNEERYKKVIYQCGLKRDLSLFKAGDATEIGEKGLTLSGGQKARITLARAVYSSAEILLLDDTHNLAMASPLADFVISIGADGQLLSQGSIDAALAKDKRLAEEFKTEENMELNENKYEDEVLEAKDGKLIAAEEVEEGHVSMGACRFLSALIDGISATD
ncbi:hypothetical protein PHLCEN_2v6412 [Hermanssonia centrifuga]|uniref:Uncharacterized protein n=1 Tax=Hermanssonia centrifuga TaxID=98765 RepID=A0A2R6NZI5_9APHY|nr:hypothetical protein PHLCEN_2v6412 [Hermanssonia centrifuga]